MDGMGAVGRSRPARDEDDAGPPGQPADRIGHETGPCLLPADGDVDLRIMQCVEHREIAFAGDAENVLHALDQQLIDKDFSPGARICHVIVPRVRADCARERHAMSSPSQSVSGYCHAGSDSTSA